MVQSHKTFFQIFTIILFILLVFSVFLTDKTIQLLLAIECSKS